VVATIPYGLDGSADLPPGDAGDWLGGVREGDDEAALSRVHDTLLRAARFEMARRRPALPDLRADELDALAREAAADAAASALARLDEFEGPSGFTTWLSKFAILEVAVKMRCRAWTGRELPGEPELEQQLSSLPPALERAIADVLTTEQRRVLVAHVLGGVPIDVLAERLHTSRGALYATLHDARHGLRGRVPQLVAAQAARR
jgi:RNA polymerase sigma-70 factor, ECF subfamily